MASDATQQRTAGGVLEEFRSNPGLLHDHGAMGQRELGQTMDVDPSILVTLLNPLEADGLVSRERDTADRRRHVVTLTAPAPGSSTAPPRRNARPKPHSSPASTTTSAQF